MKCRVRSASVKCEVQGVKRALWSVRKVFAWRCIAPGSCAGHVLGQHLCNSFAQSMHARGWLAHGTCKFYKWEGSYSISLRQLPPRLERVLMAFYFCILHICMCFFVSVFSCATSQLGHHGKKIGLKMTCGPGHWPNNVIRLWTLSRYLCAEPRNAMDRPKQFGAKNTHTILLEYHEIHTWIFKQTAAINLRNMQKADFKTIQNMDFQV